MSSIPKASYTITDKRFYETLDRYVPNHAAFHDSVQAILPAEWSVVRSGTWFHVVPPRKILPLQGWKLHLSTAERAAQNMLLTVAPLLFETSTPFKFALDARILSIMNSRSYARGGAGKFITVYPDNDQDFLFLAERLDAATAGMDGPYILSDRRYKNSRAVHYRYGGITPNGLRTAKGDHKLILVSPEGEQIPDQRLPYFVLPPWVQDPFVDAAAETSEGEENSLHDGRYVMESVLNYSNCGGVYLALDRQTGGKVVIKEARPLVNTTPNGDDAVALLQKEHRLLTKLAHTGIAPRPLNFFKDWEHSYLVEEYLENALSLRFHSGKKDVVLLTNPARAEVEECWEEYCRIFTQVAGLVKTLHENGIAFMDLSLNNVMLLPDGQLKLIDFEAAFVVGSDAPTYIYTPGFASLDDLHAMRSGFEGDYYSLGAMMLAYLMPVNGMLGLDPRAHERFLESITRDFGFPAAFPSIVAALMDRDAARRPAPAQVVSVLENSSIERSPVLESGEESDLERYRDLVQRMVDFMINVADGERTDRLFPCDPKVFVTNPLGLGYGACGVAYAIQTIRGSVPPEILSWILRQEIDPRSWPPGLYCGMAGIAWTLLELGLPEKAVQLMRRSFDHPSKHESPDMFYGLAGWGLAALKFFLETKDEEYLDQARQAGLRLIESAVQEDNGSLRWSSEDGYEWLGFAHGSSGISIFLLSLYLATLEEKFLDAGRKALQFDLDHSSPNREGGLSWKLRRGEGVSMVPYFRYGTAGVGTAVARYYWLLGEEHYRTVLEDMLPDVNRKYAIFPGRFMGLSGMGDFLLDLSRTKTFETRARMAARRVAAGVSLFQVEQPEGIAFPGYDLFRITCDYGSGNAGMALFFHRLLSGRGADFLLDELFAEDAIGRSNLIIPDTKSVAAVLGVA